MLTAFCKMDSLTQDVSNSSVLELSHLLFSSQKHPMLSRYCPFFFDCNSIIAWRSIFFVVIIPMLQREVINTKLVRLKTWILSELKKMRPLLVKTLHNFLAVLTYGLCHLTAIKSRHCTPYWWLEWQCSHRASSTATNVF